METDRRVAFVTGASSGIGRATAEAFVRKGYAVVLVDRDAGAGAGVEAALRDVGECAFIACDVTNDDQVRGAVEETVRLYGRLDAAFNAAGIGGPHIPTAEFALEDWNAIIAVNLSGVFHCMRHQIRQMLRQGGGVIVNCASIQGLRGIEAMPAYVAAKHGVVGLTKVAALDYARQGLRINAVCPGLIDTPMADTAFATPQGLQDYLAFQPNGRIGTAEEVAAGVIWLCDPSASLVSGQAIALDGAYTAR